jgi:hypothetical protein
VGTGFEGAVAQRAEAFERNLHDDAELDEMRLAVIDRWDVDPERCQIAAEGAAFVI